MVLTRQITGESMVSVGEEVAAETILGTKRFSREVKYRLPGAKLTVSPGEKIVRGQLIGSRKVMLGLRSSKILAPVDGEVKSIGNNGEVVFQEYGQAEKIAAGCWGKIAAIEDGTVSIETMVKRIFGATGIGGSCSGFIKNLAKSDEIVTPQLLSSSVAGMIVCGGSLLLRETVEKAQALGACGIIAGGINYREFAAFKKENHPFTIVITDGFGAVPMGINIPEVYAMVDGSEAMVTIPVNIKTVSKSEEKEVERVPLNIGTVVRILAAEKMGRYGKITAISEKEEVLPSGLKDFVAEVKVGEEMSAVAVSNLQAVI